MKLRLEAAALEILPFVWPTQPQRSRLRGGLALEWAGWTDDGEEEEEEEDEEEAMMMMMTRHLPKIPFYVLSVLQTPPALQMEQFESCSHATGERKGRLKPN
jgi:hypothetical protein